ncbi:uncharacterized protein LOC128991946 [Macrosteles quadrilineatus]|uniref:uncharacterized protein LOC128991946 n=1 Tax=Macrosteles quadrilineatus TaxID=74068 RepID=UPI0023E12715|nr:uncharacterized protein LOC128991946 [Macrosteles quadrilineatus]
MSRERRWWGVPRSFAGFSLWRLSNPFETPEDPAECGKKGSEGSPRTTPEIIARREESEGKEKSKSPSGRLERSPSKSRSRSRSRSSSFSFKSRKSSERETPEKEVEVKKSVLPDISFTFFSEQDRELEYVVVDSTLKSVVDSSVERNSQGDGMERIGNNDTMSDDFRRSERPLSMHDDRVKKVEEVEEEENEVRHLSTVVMTMKPVDYSNIKDLKLAVETIVKENEYEVLKEKEPPYSSPRASSVECFPVYATIVKSNKSSTLDSNETPNFVDAPTSIPTTESSALDSPCSKDFDETLPAVPTPDWDEVSLNSEYNADYAELTTPEPVDPLESPVPENTETKEELAYCQHRAELKPSLRRVTLLRCKKTVRRTPSIGRVKNKLGRAWRKVRGWWIEERIRLNEVILKRDSVREASVVSDVPETVVRSMSDEDIYVGLKGGDEMRSVDDVMSTCSTLPARYLRRRKRSPTPVLSRSSSVAAFRRSKFFPEGQNGFEELRRYIKQGGDFCKDLSAVLQERSEAELQYSKTLSKLSAKLLKLTKESSSSTNTAWQRAAVEMDTQSEIHRVFATALSEEVVKPLKQLLENQHRTRKAVETAVDKTGKSLAEWRSAECKAKKQSFASARENEKMQDAMLDVRIAGVQSPTASTLHLHSTKLVSDKENAKLESKRRKAEDSVKKADVEYYTYCIRAERARLEWESAVLRGSQCFQTLEEERLQQLKELTDTYLHHYKEVGPKLTQSAARLVEPVSQISVVADLETVVTLRENGQPAPEQLLPDFYAEHITLAMNRERRRQALVKLLHLIRQDLDRERRGKQGVENLARALKQTPTFGTDDSQQNVTEKLHHMRSMLAYLEAARYKVQGALAEMEGRNKESHPLSPHIHITRDRQGLQQSILKVPLWVRKESVELTPDNLDWTDRGTADGNSVQPDSDFDEFSSQGSERDYQSSVISQCQYPVLSEQSQCAGRCKALYHYAANLYDELNLNPGDVINIHDKQADGWWLGELNGVVGIFPATYVEEIK